MFETILRKHHNKLKSLCDPLFDLFGFDMFYYQVITADKRIASISPNIDLLEFYFNEEKLYPYNPFLMQSDKISSGLYFDREVEDRGFKSSYSKMENKLGSVCVLRKVMHTPQGCVQFGFGRPVHNTGVDGMVVNEHQLLNKFCDYFAEEAGLIMKKALETPFEMSENSLNQISLNSTLSDESKKAFLINCGMDENLVFNKLSPREKDTLKMYAQGMSCAEVAKNLSLSVRTVESYIDHIKNKLDCQSKAELFQKAKELISYKLI